MNPTSSIVNSGQYKMTYKVIKKSNNLLNLYKFVLRIRQQPDCGAMANISPFVHLPAFSLVVCQECHYACVADEVGRHLKRQIHSGISKSRAREIKDGIKELHDVHKTHNDDMHNFRFPPPETEPIPYILPPESNGYACNVCPYVVRSKQGIKRHYKRAHGWKNDQRLGRPGKNDPRTLRPWREGVRCQRFFLNRQGCQWFEVQRPVSPMYPLCTLQLGDILTVSYI